MGNVKKRNIKVFKNLNGNIFSLIKEKRTKKSYREIYVTVINKFAKKGWIYHKVNTMNLVLISGKLKLFYLSGKNKKINKVNLNLPFKEIISIKPNTWFLLENNKNFKSLVLNIMDKKHEKNEYIKKNLDEII